MRRWQRYRTGASEVVRTDPIPPGVYWIDSIDASWYPDPSAVESLRTIYTEMLGNVFPGAWTVLRTTHHDASMNVPLPTGSPLLGIPDNPARDWILFEVVRHIPRWPPGTMWGLPSIAPRGRDTEENDTVQKPPPEKRGLDFELGGTSIKTYALIGIAIVGGLIAYNVTK